jgi:ankyrin repeat protein
LAENIESPETVDLLLRHKEINVNAEDGSGWTPLTLAVAREDLDTVNLLWLCQGTDVTCPNSVESKTPWPMTPLKYAMNKKSDFKIATSFLIFLADQKEKLFQGEIDKIDARAAALQDEIDNLETLKHALWAIKHNNDNALGEERYRLIEALIEARSVPLSEKDLFELDTYRKNETYYKIKGLGLGDHTRVGREIKDEILYPKLEHSSKFGFINKPRQKR